MVASRYLTIEGGCETIASLEGPNPPNQEKGQTMTDDTNPRFVFSTTATELLSKAANGEIDFNQLARQELANRGLNTDGKWVGFEKAKEIRSE